MILELATIFFFKKTNNTYVAIPRYQSTEKMCNSIMTESYKIYNISLIFFRCNLYTFPSADPSESLMDAVGLKLTDCYAGIKYWP